MNLFRVLQSSSRLPQRMALTLACATFPLIWVGGLVTTYDAGMAVPDWPNTFGYNLFLYPWQTWISGPWDLFIEHSHRLLGAFVGILAILFLVVTFVVERRYWMKIVATVALLGVISQGVLGGMRVLLDDRQLAMMHGCIGPAFFALTVALVAFTSRSWNEVNMVPATRVGRLYCLAVLTPLWAYVQLIFGATLRHMPLDASPNFFQTAVLFHLFFAVVLAGHVVLFAVEANRQKMASVVKVPAWGLSLLVLLQVVLGIGTWVAKYNWPAWFAEFSWTAGNLVHEKSLGQAMLVTAHVACGSLILATSVWTSLFVFRLKNPWSSLHTKSSQRVAASEPRSQFLRSVMEGAV